MQSALAPGSSSMVIETAQKNSQMLLNQDVNRFGSVLEKKNQDCLGV